MKPDVVVTYRNEGTVSYLTLSPANASDLIRYQVKMLENNQIPNLLPLSVTERNCQTELFYEITSCVTLAQLLERKKLEKQEVYSLLRSLLGACRELPEYQLPISGLLLTPDRVFVRTGDFAVRFVYLPAADPQEFLEPIRTFLTDLIMHGSIAASSDNFVVSLLDLLNRPDLSLQLLQEFLQDQLQEDTPVPFDTPQAPAQRPARKPEPEPLWTPELDTLLSNPLFDTTEFAATFAPKSLVHSPDMPPAPSDASGKRKGASPKRLVFIVLQGVLVLVLGWLFQRGVLAAEDGSFSLLNIAGALLICGGIDFLVFHRLFHGKTTESQPEASEPIPKSAPKASPFSMPPQNECSPPPRPAAPAAAQTPPRPAAWTAPPAPPTPMERPIPPSPPVETVGSKGLDGYDETVFMDDAATEPHVLYYENGLPRSTRIQNGRLLVGKQKGQVDLVLPSARVSHIHAEIKRQGERFVVIDCNSKNGTFLNDSRERITSSTPYPLQNGDVIRLADAELVFQC